MLNDYEVVLVKIDKTSIPDGLGGFEEGYREGAEFKGVVTHDSSTEMKIAEKMIPIGWDPPNKATAIPLNP